MSQSVSAGTLSRLVHVLNQRPDQVVSNHQAKSGPKVALVIFESLPESMHREAVVSAERSLMAWRQIKGMAVNGMHGPAGAAHGYRQTKFKGE